MEILIKQITQNHQVFPTYRAQYITPGLCCERETLQEEILYKVAQSTLLTRVKNHQRTEFKYCSDMPFFFVYRTNHVVVGGTYTEHSDTTLCSDKVKEEYMSKLSYVIPSLKVRTPSICACRKIFVVESLLIT